MMVGLQPCTGLGTTIANAASAFCSVELEVKGDNANDITEISAELQKEKQKNAELTQRILALESQINERNKDSVLLNGQVVCKHSRGRCVWKFKRQRTDRRIRRGSEMKGSSYESLHKIDVYDQDQLVNWMGMEDTQFAHSERVLKDSDSAMDNESGDEGSSNFEDNDIQGDCKDGVDSASVKCVQEINEQFLNGSVVDYAGGLDMQCEGPKTIGGCKNLLNMLLSSKEVKDNGSSIPQKKPQKMAFCQKEVKRILESEALLEKNAQAHTIRKVIVFASLGIRHGCDDMYELDFSHFSIVQKGEPYVSPQNPGEHVLYAKPGVRRKIFYPNRQNPILCPVQVLEEERAMRPSDSSCPSCLFLCIKYGGRTRNLPQNEYVRQRMGRNKLKSFGPVICQMAMLVHVRSGSFFFKALGITLLFMAGFPDALVQRETKYRNLDLLQKYYRRDEDAEGEELFLSHPLTNDVNANKKASKRTEKMIPREPKRRKQTISARRSHKEASNAESTRSTSVPPKQFELMGCASAQPTRDASLIPNTTIGATGANSSYHSQSSYPVFPPQRANSFIPVVYWPPPLNAISACPHSSSYSYRYPYAASYIPIYPQPYYGHSSCIPPNNPLIKESGAVPADADSKSYSSTSSTEPKQE